MDEYKRRPIEEVIADLLSGKVKPTYRSTVGPNGELYLEPPLPNMIRDLEEGLRVHGVSE